LFDGSFELFDRAEQATEQRRARQDALSAISNGLIMQWAQE
jgi:hypothetical protein